MLPFQKVNLLEVPSYCLSAGWTCLIGLDNQACCGKGGGLGWEGIQEFLYKKMAQRSFPFTKFNFSLRNDFVGPGLRGKGRGGGGGGAPYIFPSQAQG